MVAGSAFTIRTEKHGSATRNDAHRREAIQGQVPQLGLNKEEHLANPQEDSLGSESNAVPLL